MKIIKFISFSIFIWLLFALLPNDLFRFSDDIYMEIMTGGQRPSESVLEHYRLLDDFGEGLFIGLPVVIVIEAFFWIFFSVLSFWKIREFFPFFRKNSRLIVVITVIVVLFTLSIGLAIFVGLILPFALIFGISALISLGKERLFIKKAQEIEKTDDSTKNPYTVGSIIFGFIWRFLIIIIIPMFWHEANRGYNSNIFIFYSNILFTALKLFDPNTYIYEDPFFTTLWVIFVGFSSWGFVLLFCLMWWSWTINILKCFFGKVPMITFDRVTYKKLVAVVFFLSMIGGIYKYITISHLQNETINLISFETNSVASLSDIQHSIKIPQSAKDNSGNSYEIHFGVETNLSTNIVVLRNGKPFVIKAFLRKEYMNELPLTDFGRRTPEGALYSQKIKERNGDEKYMVVYPEIAYSQAGIGDVNGDGNDEILFYDEKSSKIFGYNLEISEKIFDISVPKRICIYHDKWLDRIRSDATIKYNPIEHTFVIVCESPQPDYDVSGNYVAFIDSSGKILNFANGRFANVVYEKHSNKFLVGKSLFNGKGVLIHTFELEKDDRIKIGQAIMDVNNDGRDEILFFFQIRGKMIGWNEGFGGTYKYLYYLKIYDSDTFERLFQGSIPDVPYGKISFNSYE